jgi:hypothetical protein
VLVLNVDACKREREREREEIGRERERGRAGERELLHAVLVRAERESVPA